MDGEPWVASRVSASASTPVKAGAILPCEFEAAGPQHVSALEALILRHGPNPWNWLPEDGIRKHMHDIAEGRAHAELAFQAGALIGAVTFCVTQAYRQYEPPSGFDSWQGYICEAVVHADAAGQGLGSRLLRHAVQRLQAMGMQTIYIDRHEENAASAGMMRKAGFTEVCTFDEPERRPNGSRRTTVCRITLPTKDLLAKTDPPGL